ncbi:hypothetical protein HWC99_gp61 [Flavobacterium phage vB_FspS_tant8-1]|uniref:Uncharacterized protein n=1 Tax=Flavobacterium phage vB_FspS_tant8-1 TaxID=2686278 RepID=A0A6B9LG87_9CAUD|nr:hypothetical protein HWC99_gp61 [Flavobacterium phage vB_FspS_tant8-1]QHB40992.1 hypothetical protein tant81_gp061 [Flavobacterium phage vB_FspS_tant8-1]
MKDQIKKYLKDIVILILLIILIFSITKCTENKNQAISETKSLNDSTKYFKNKLMTETASKIVLETSNKLLKQEILQSDLKLKKLTDEFSRVKSIVKYKTEIQIDSVPVYFTDTIPCEFERIGKYYNKDFKFNWEFNQKKFELKDIEIPNETTIITGFKRKWIFGRQILTTDITNSNELIKTTNVQTIEIKIPKKFHETRLFNFGVGFATGFFLFK